jgi:hypothetical protein
LDRVVIAFQPGDAVDSILSRVDTARHRANQGGTRARSYRQHASGAGRQPAAVASEQAV